jgi:hypothetical protein
VLIIFIALAGIGLATTGMSFAVWVAVFAALRFASYDTSGMASAHSIATIGIAVLIINVLVVVWMRSSYMYRKQLLIQRVRNPIENIGLLLVVGAYLARRWAGRKDRV